MSFRSRFLALNEHEQRLVSSILNTWNGCEKRVCSNLQNEHFLDDDSMDEVLKTMINFHSSTVQGHVFQEHLIEDLKAKLREEFYNSLQLKGDFIGCSSPISFGTVLPLERFRNYLEKKHRNYFFLDGAFENFIDDLKEWPDITRTFKDYGEFLIREAEHLIWVAWHPVDHKESVYDLLLKWDTQEMRKLLGLSQPINELYNPLIAFSFQCHYCIKDGFKLYRPTFCDSDFNPQWQPANYNNGEIFHGYIRPKYEGSNLPVPEAVGRSKFLKIKNITNCYTLND